MIHYKSTEEIELMRESCALVSSTLALVATFLKAGMSTLEVDGLAEEFIRDNKATPSFKNFNGYPYATCISVNDAIVHGFPQKALLKEGDIVSVDIGVYRNGFHGDSAYTFAIGQVSDDIRQLLKAMNKSSDLVSCTYFTQS